MVAPATRVLVATPYPSSPTDSATAVLIGDGLRNKLSSSIGSDWLVIPRAQMNEQLVKWGYSRDQLFAPETARQMVTPMSARVFVMTTFNKNSEGKYVATARMSGASDEAGQVVKYTQLAGQSVNDFANKLAEQIAVVFKAYPDARACNDNVMVNKVKAVESANQAIKKVPNYGFPEYCLGLLERMKDSTSSETLRHFTNATIGDPMSLKAWSQISIIHQLKKDTSAVVQDFLTMLQVAPTNRELADQAVKIFRSYNRPDAAVAVINAQIAQDPNNADWPDLKGNMCAAAAAGESDPAKAKPNFECAYTQFSKVYELDPARADSNFFPKIVYVAGTAADSMKWARIWATKQSGSVDPYELQAQIFAASGQTDSMLKTIKMILAIDPADLKPLLSAEIALLNKQRYDDAIALGAYASKGDENVKNQFAGVLVTFADSAGRRTPQDDSAMVKLGKAVVAFNPPGKNYLEFGHYFIVRGLQNGLTVQSKAARDQKSCDVVKAYIAFLDVLEPSLVAISASANAQIASYGNQLLTPVQSERKAIPELQKAFCKP